MKKRFVKFSILIVVLSVIGAELVCRFALGVGNPPLWMDDPNIEYMMKPNQHGWQLHNEYYYNSYSMRSEEFPRNKSSEDELRVLFLGDSVVNGGNLTDQGDLASEIIKHKLKAMTNRKVVTGNITSGSWGPKNLLEYFRKFGTFDADFAILILSSHDSGDYPDYKPIAGTRAIFPAKKPFCALSEAMVRYVPMFLPFKKEIKQELSDEQREYRIEKTKKSFFELIDILRNADVKVIIVQHLEENEIRQGHDKGYDLIKDWSVQTSVGHYDFESEFRKQLEEGETPYRGNIHVNAIGQRILAENITDIIVSNIRDE